MPVLETKHLLLPEFEPADFGALKALSVEEMQTCGRWRPSDENAPEGVYAVVEKSAGEVVGWGGVVTRTPEDNDAELVYGIIGAGTANGYVLELAYALRDWAFTERNVATLFAAIDPANAPTIDILKRLDFAYLRFEADETDQPMLVYTLVNTEKRKRDLEARRLATIQQLHDAFDITLRRSKPSQIVTKPNALAAPHVERALAGKRWDSPINDGDMVNEMSDPDSLGVISHEAFAYFLPAYLISVSVHRRGWTISYLVINFIPSILPLLSIAQVEAVAACLELQLVLVQDEPQDYLIPAIEEVLIETWAYLEEAKQGKAN